MNGYERDSVELGREIGRLLSSAGQSLAVAESCTGGMLGSIITDASGSSSYFPGGVIAYSNEAKTRELGVDSTLLNAEGAVSEGVARQLASGVRARFATNLGIGITGIAGPGGGTAAKPVGLVCIAVSDGTQCVAREFHLDGDRRKVRQSACAEALNMLRDILETGER